MLPAIKVMRSPTQRIHVSWPGEKPFFTSSKTKNIAPALLAVTNEEWTYRISSTYINVKLAEMYVALIRFVMGRTYLLISVKKRRSRKKQSDK